MKRYVAEHFRDTEGEHAAKRKHRALPQGERAKQNATFKREWLARVDRRARERANKAAGA